MICECKVKCYQFGRIYLPGERIDVEGAEEVPTHFEKVPSALAAQAPARKVVAKPIAKSKTKTTGADAARAGKAVPLSGSESDDI